MRPMAIGLLALSAALEWLCPGRAAAEVTPAAPLPRISTRDGHFVVKATGREFRPFGFHYIRLRPDGVHYVFAPSLYDPVGAEAMLADLEAHGANIVRVFVGGLETTDAEGLSQPFVQDLCDFLVRAARHRVYVLLVVDWIPHGRRYDTLLTAVRTDVGGMQALLLDDAHLAAKARYLRDFVGAIRRHDRSLLSTVFAYELENEACIQLDAPPFSQAAGLFSLDGRQYDVADDGQVQALMDAAARRWVGPLVRAIRREDPEAMVGASVFTYAAVGRTGPGHARTDSTADCRVPLRPLALAATPLSYVDVHLYAASPEGLERDLKSIEWPQLKERCRQARKPLLVGEFGTFRVVHKTAPEAAYAMGWYLQQIVGLGFSGAIYWTYDCEEQAPLWNAKSADGAILKALTTARDHGLEKDR